MISIIIPVYNVEKFIRQCLDSILSQSYKNYEVILIDDKSENERNVDKAYNFLKDGSDKIFILSGDKEPESLKKLKNETDAEVITINKLDNISDEDRDNKKTYTSLMKDNIELLRRGTE